MIPVLIISSMISIHALRKESDSAPLRSARLRSISIHALRKESDWEIAKRYVPGLKFQSTLSVRRAT